MPCDCKFQKFPETNSIEHYNTWLLIMFVFTVLTAYKHNTVRYNLLHGGSSSSSNSNSRSYLYTHTGKNLDSVEKIQSPSSPYPKQLCLHWSAAQSTNFFDLTHFFRVWFLSILSCFFSKSFLVCNCSIEFIPKCDSICVRILK